MVAISSEVDLTLVKKFVDKLVQDNEFFDNQSMRHSAPIEHPGGTERRENVLGGDGDTARGGGDAMATEQTAARDDEGQGEIPRGDAAREHL